MHRKPIDLAFVLAASIGVALTLVAVAATPPTGTARLQPSPLLRGVAEVSFETDVAPILQNRCVQCHGGVDEDGDVRAEASLTLTSYEGVIAGSEYGPVVTAGDPDDSMLLNLIEWGDMPEEGDPVPEEEIALIRMWIAEGALNN